MTTDTPIAATVGMFDGVHVGHRHILATLKATAERLGLRPVVVTFDRHPREVLSSDGTPFPRLSTNKERARLIRDCGIEEIVELHFDRAMASLSACEFLEQVLAKELGAKALVLGYDNMFGNKGKNDFALLPQEAKRLEIELIEAQAIEVEGLEDCQPGLRVSSTKIRKYLTDGEMEKATAMLGIPYSITGTVAQGFHIGRTLGFPTANITLPDANKLLPADGVYAVVCEGRAAMANLGSRPTFGSDARTLEVHLIGRHEELYGQQMTVQFISRLRDIRRFASPEALAAQLESDKAATLNLLKA